VGFTFAWYRIAVTLPEQLDGVTVTGARVWFETNVDNYGEVWIDGKLDRAGGAIAGINAQQRVEVSAKAAPGARHIIACLVANGPLAEPRGGIFMRYATLACESRD
ncbi:MAG: gluconolactonase, partial [Deltaproteobacteria bacterium]|nr:gluconolactonase [Deltaproteobacteria bacterium]